MRLLKRAMVLMLAVAVLGVGITAVVAANHGYRLYAVRTGSMYPAYPTGTLLLDAPSTAAAIPAGSVVTFRVGGNLITHRVFNTSAAGLTTKGDANRTPDAWTVPYGGVVGQVIAAVPRGGYVLVFLRQPTGPIALVGGTFALIMLWRMFFLVDDSNPAVASTKRLPSHPRGLPSVT